MIAVSEKPIFLVKLGFSRMCYLNLSEDDIVRQCDDEQSDYEDEDCDNDEEGHDGGDDEVVTLVETNDEDEFDDVPVSAWYVHRIGEAIYFEF